MSEVGAVAEKNGWPLEVKVGKDWPGIETLYSFIIAPAIYIAKLQNTDQNYQDF